jgi:putative membrane protein
MNPHCESPDRSAAGYLGLWLKGVLMGAADVVPGVSGGTMAFILGIYEELIFSIRSFDVRFFRLFTSFRLREALAHVRWKFLAAVGTGILFAVFSMARGLSWLLHNHPVPVWAFFFGLIVASLFAVGLRIETWSPGVPVGIALGAAGTYLLVGLVPVSTPGAAWFLFLSGALAICAMILPGISGAFILVLMGKYLYVLDAVNERDFMTLALVAGGAVVGLLCFARLLNWLFRRHHDITIAVLTGLMLGSLRRVWPWKLSVETGRSGAGEIASGATANYLPSQWTTEVTLAVGLALAGFLAVVLIAGRHRTT